jgi:septal ring factor EnvC (AmiA/AmiB activator)
MEESHSRQSIHYERAHSAQSEHLSNFRNSNSSWQRNYEGCVAKHADDQFNSLDRDYKRQLHQQKVENTKVKQLRTLASEQRQRLSKERQSFSSCLSQVSRDRADFVKKVKDNHKKLETFQKNKT